MLRLSLCDYENKDPQAINDSCLLCNYCMKRDHAHVALYVHFTTAKKSTDSSPVGRKR